jgi:hypothetical protein
MVRVHSMVRPTKDEFSCRGVLCATPTILPLKFELMKLCGWAEDPFEAMGAGMGGDQSFLSLLALILFAKCFC